MPSIEPIQVPVVVEIASSLAGKGGAFVTDRYRQAVAAKFDDLMETLGIPGRADVYVNMNDDLAPDRPIRLTVNEHLCRYPNELLLWMASYVCGIHARFDVSAADMLSETKRGSESEGVVSDGTTVDFVAQTCLEIAKISPEVFFALSQAEAYAAALAEFSGKGTAGGAWPPSAPWLLMILKEVIAQRRSIRDCPLVATILAEAGASDDRATIAEELISALGVQTVEVHLSNVDEDLVRDDNPEAVSASFAFLRHGLFAETGVEYPSFRMAIVEDLKPGAFAFLFGCLRTPPMIRLRANECMVNDTAKSLKDRSSPSSPTEVWPVEPLPTLNPATAQPAAIVPLHLRTSLDGGLTIWDSRGHLILCMAEALRRLGSCFVDLNLAEKRLRFIQNAYPTLASAIGTEQYTNAQIARVLRRLVAEGISIVNGRLIFDLLVKHASARRDERRLLECVRAGLGRVIRHKLARGTDPVTVYLLDPRVEERLAKQRWRRRTDETLREAILSSVRTEIRELERTAPTAIVPSILTTIQARSAVKAVLQDEFPRLAVICYQDLPRDTNIQPIARLLLA